MWEKKIKKKKRNRTMLSHSVVVPTTVCTGFTYCFVFEFSEFVSSCPKVPNSFMFEFSELSALSVRVVSRAQKTARESLCSVQRLLEPNWIKRSEELHSDPSFPVILDPLSFCARYVLWDRVVRKAAATTRSSALSPTNSPTQITVY